MDIPQRVREFIFSNFYVTDGEELSDAASLLSLGIVDSTGILEVIGFLEEEFAIVVEDEDATPANLESIERISAFVSRKLSERVPEPMRSARMSATRKPRLCRVVAYCGPGLPRPTTS